MQSFKLGIRFQPIGKDDKSVEMGIAFKHWALVFSPVEKPEWSARVELVTDQNDVIASPTSIVDGELPSYPLGTWTGSMADITDLIQAHPMRYRKYSAAYNNCQQWAATMLILLETLASGTTGRKLDITEKKRHKEVLNVLGKSGNKLYHRPNWQLKGAHLAGVGGGAAAMGAAVVAAEATTTVLVPAGGIAGFFGATTAVVVPTAGAVTAATVMFPLTVISVVGIGATYVIQNAVWKDKTQFDDPRRGGLPANSDPLSRKEKGEFLTVVRGSLAVASESSAVSGSSLVGLYSGAFVGAVTVAFAPAVAPLVAPIVAATAIGAVAVGINKGS